MAVKKISELPTAGVGDITPDDVLILNDGSATKKTLLADLLQGTEEFDANFNNLVVNGDLTVQGTTTTVNTEEVTLADNQIVLNSDYSGSTPSEDAGIVVNRDQAGNKSLLWDEADDKWSIGTETFQANIFEGDLIGSVFSDDRTMLVDGLNSKVTGPVDTESVTNSEGNLSVTADNYLTIDSVNNGQIEIGRFSGIGNVIIGNDSNQTDVSIDGNVIIKSSTTFDFNGASITGTNFARSGTGDNVSFSSVVSSLTGNVISISNGAVLVDATNNKVFLENNTTDDLPEGTLNRYFSDSLVDDHLSGGTGVSYDAGIISIGQSVGTDDNVTFNQVTSDLYGSVYTDDNTEMINATDATVNLGNNSTDDLSEGTSNLYYANSLVENYLNGGTGVSFSNGEISIGQSVGTDDNVAFNNVTVNGNFTVSGTTTTVNTETILVADNTILLNSDYTGDSPSENSGIEVSRGTQPNKTLVWDETNDYWTVGVESFVAATFEGNLTGDVTGTVSDISNHTTDDLSEGSTNLYYADSLTRAALSADGDLVYNQSTGEFSFEERTDSEVRLLFSALGDLTYDFNTGQFSYSISNNTTDDLPEGTDNLYYADSLVDSHLSGGTGVSYSTGTISIGQAVGVADDVVFNTVSSDVISTADSTVLVDAANNTLYFGGNTTDDLTEGTTNLYYSNTLVDSHLSGGTGVSYDTGSISIGQAVNIDSDVNFNTVSSNGIVSTSISSTDFTTTNISADVINSAIAIVGDLSGSVFADDSTPLVDGVNGTLPYTPSVESVWQSPTPETVSEALDRLAAAVAALGENA